MYTYHIPSIGFNLNKHYRNPRQDQLSKEKIFEEARYALSELDVHSYFYENAFVDDKEGLLEVLEKTLIALKEMSDELYPYSIAFIEQLILFLATYSNDVHIVSPYHGSSDGPVISIVLNDVNIKYSEHSSYVISEDILLTQIKNIEKFNKLVDEFDNEFFSDLVKSEIGLVMISASS